MHRVFSLLIFWLLPFAYSQMQEIDYAAGMGEFEFDFESARFDGIADGWAFSHSNIWPAGIQVDCQIDRYSFVSGRGSQRIEFLRSINGASTFILFSSIPFDSLSENYPQPGDRVNVSFYLRTSDLYNLRYSVEVQIVTGDNRVFFVPVLPPRNLPLPTWTPIQGSFLLPDNSQRFWICLKVEFGRGPLSGTFWLDELRVTAGKTLPSRPASALKIARLYTIDRDWITTAANYDLYVGALDLGFIRLQTSNPDMKCFYYTVGWESLFFSNLNGNRWVGYGGDFFPYNWVDRYRPDWFLTNPQGNRISWSYDPNVREYLMDFGDSNCRSHVFSKLLEVLDRSGGRNPQWQPDGIFLDNFANAIWTGQSAKYPTIWQRAAALQSYFEHYQNQIGSEGFPALTNVYIGDWFEGGPYANVLPLVNGILIEGFLVEVFRAQYLEPDRVAWQLRYVIEHPEQLAVLVGRRFESDPQMFKYILAGFYLVNRPGVYCMLGSDGAIYSDSVLVPEYYLPIGEPTSSQFEIAAGEERSGALYVRTYQKGLILLNTSPTETFSYLIAANYRDTDGNPYQGNTLVQVPPRTGFVLYQDEESGFGPQGNGNRELSFNHLVDMAKDDSASDSPSQLLEHFGLYRFIRWR